MELKNNIYVTYLSNDRDYKGVLLLNYNLKKYNHKYNLECIVLEGVSNKVKNILEKSKIKLHVFVLKNVLSEFNIDGLYSEYLINKHYYGKYLIFFLTNYNKIVYLDTDILVKKNIDELFDYDTTNSIYMTYDTSTYEGDIYFKKKAFNSGVIILEPSLNMYNNLYKGLYEYKDNIFNNNATDQTIFNFLNEKSIINISYLNFKYNYIAIFGENKNIIDSDISMVHFILFPKPWNILDFDENIIGMYFYSDIKIFCSEWLELYFSMTNELLDEIMSKNVYFSYNKKYIVDNSIYDEKKEISLL